MAASSAAPMPVAGDPSPWQGAVGAGIQVCNTAIFPQKNFQRKVRGQIWQITSSCKELMINASQQIR